MKKSKKNHFIIISLLVLLLGGVGIILFLNQKQQVQTAENSPVSSPTKNDNPKDQPVDNPDTDNSKKILASQIREDLQKDLEKIKKGEKNENGNYVCSWSKSLGEGCSDPRGNEWRLTFYGSLETQKKYEERKIHGRGWIYVFPEELESNDWKEIEGLIQQVKELEKKEKEKETQNTREEQAKIDQKLNSNPKIFLYKDLWEWWENDPRDYDKRHVFRGIENGQEFFLVFPENHSAIASLNQKQEGTLVLIEGVENIPLQSNGKVDSWKKVNLSDKITITLSNP